MKLLGVDLAFTQTGWVLIETGQSDQLVDWGEITTPARRKGESNASWDLRRSNKIATSFREIILDHIPLVCAFEVSDWHQRLNAGNWQKLYARERQVQQKLGMAKGILLVMCGTYGVEPMYAPVTEVKKFLGAQRKDVIASMVKSWYPQLVDESDHVTDAMAIAMYASGQIQKREMYELAESIT